MKYVDDMSLMTSIDLKQSLENNPNLVRPTNFHDRTGHILPRNDCVISDQLNQLSKYVKDHQMRINEEKTKVILFNPSKKWDFTPSVSLGIKSPNLEVVDEIKLLGIIITSDLSWNVNTAFLVRRAYARMQLLHKLIEYNVPIKDLILIYTLYIRSVLVQSAVV